LEDHPKSSELDISTYIHEIANSNYPGLNKIIKSKLMIFTDLDAIEDLNKALKKL